MLHLGSLDIANIATALSDQADRGAWLIDRHTGRVVFVAEGENVEQALAEGEATDLIALDPVPQDVRHQDMVDFAEGLSDRAARNRLIAVLQERGAPRGFKNELHVRNPELKPVWVEWRETRGQRRAVSWLLAQELIDGYAAKRFASENPDPDLP